MQDSPSKLGIEEVVDPKVAEIFSSEAKFRYFAPFIKAEQSVKNAAVILKLSQSTTLYHIKKFLNLGILRIIRQEKRAGRAIKIYKSSAEKYYVPFTIIKAEARETITQDSEIVLMKRLVKYTDNADPDVFSGQGIYLYKTKAGQIASTFSSKDSDFKIQKSILDSLDDNQPAIVSAWSLPSLSYKNAKSLQKEMVQLYRRYESFAAQTGEQQYLVHLAMAPISKD